jgi:hypothetical protein
VLCQMKRRTLIESFLQHGLFDDSLPLDKQLNKFGWNKSDVSNFRDKQYKMIAPFFHLNARKLKHYYLNSKIQLPFLSRCKIGSGAHGSVSKVCLHEDHYFCEENKVRPYWRHLAPCCLSFCVYLLADTNPRRTSISPDLISR